MNFKIYFLVFVFSLSLIKFGFANEIDVSGYIAVESRAFVHDGKFSGQDDQLEGSVVIHPEFRSENEDGTNIVVVSPYFRGDSQDDERTHFDMREAYWLLVNGDYEFTLGMRQVFWGVTESNHLVDIINQTAAVEDIDQEDKLGQPMVKLSRAADWGTVSLFAMPYFRERTFPGRDGRLRTPLVVDTDNPVFENEHEEEHIDFALRYAHYFGDFDVGIYHFYGTSREPRLLPDTFGTKLIPHYDIIHQTGLDLQWTFDAWLWKLEALYRTGHGRHFAATAFGFEYTFYQIFGGNSDLGLLVEHLFDDRSDSAPQTIFDNDFFSGVRWVLNDAQDTSLLFGVIYDPETKESFYNLEAERRIGDSWSMEIQARLFDGSTSEDPLFIYEDEDYFQIRAAKYF